VSDHTGNKRQAEALRERHLKYDLTQMPLGFLDTCCGILSEGFHFDKSKKDSRKRLTP
jgi:hypothetical protein